MIYNRKQKLVLHKFFMKSHPPYLKICTNTSFILHQCDVKRGFQDFVFIWTNLDKSQGNGLVYSELGMILIFKIIFILVPLILF